MPRLASRLVLAAVLGLLAAAGPAQAAWEAPLRLDQTSEGFGNSSFGDVAVGDNGLATILFYQSDDDGTKLYATRRAADATAWLTPPWTVSPLPDGLFEIQAAPDGATAGAYRDQVSGSSGTPLPGDETADTQNVIGLGWPAGSTGQAPKTGDVGDQGDESVPPVDADGRGRGWTAFIHPDKTLYIVSFDLADPSKGKVEFKVAPIPRDPIGNRSLDETLSRSNPRIDVNDDGDVIVSFVEERRQFSEDEQDPVPVEKVYAVRKLNGSTGGFSEQQPISHSDATEDVNEHDPAIVENGDATILFAGDPARDTQDPNTTGPDRVFARRWLATGSAPRDPDEGPEFVSSSAANAADVSDLRAEAGPEGRVTAAWRQGSQLNAAERFGTWNAPQALSTNTTAYDIAVDTAGVATAVFREATAVKARRRTAGQQWEAASTISTAPASADVPPRVDAGMPLQADAYFVQNDGVRKGAFAARFTGAAPIEPPAPPKPDTLDCPNDIEILPGDAGANSIAGTDERETILGGEGDDTLDGNGGDDCVRGQGGNDTANGDGGNDDVGGGDGDDRVTGGDGDDRLAGNAGADTVKGDAGTDVGNGGDGNDTLDGGDGNDLLDGAVGDDTVRGGTGNDALAGFDGNDTIYGQAGSNVMSGGLGNDRIVGGAETDSVFGDAGDDNVSGGAGNDTVAGGDGNDRVRGGNGVNALDGGIGNDNLKGGGQSDSVLGGAGIDVLAGLGGIDTLLGGTGADKLFGGAGNDKLRGNGSADRLRGGNGGDRLKGGSGKDRVFGESGKDRIFGNVGGDVLNGGGSKDRISGGSGNDRIAAVDNKRDVVKCGAGKKDRVVADKVDRVSKDCERVKRRK